MMLKKPPTEYDIHFGFILTTPAADLLQVYIANSVLHLAVIHLTLYVVLVEI